MRRVAVIALLLLTCAAQACYGDPSPQLTDYLKEFRGSVRGLPWPRDPAARLLCRDPWQGIRCDASGTKVHVDISGLDLTGVYPAPENGWVPGIATWNASRNNLRGPIPVLGAGMSDPEIVDVSHNRHTEFRIRAPASSAQSRMQSPLKYLDVSDNLLQGAFPMEALSRLRAMTALLATHNNFTSFAVSNGTSSGTDGRDTLSSALAFIDVSNNYIRGALSLPPRRAGDRTCRRIVARANQITEVDASVWQLYVAPDAPATPKSATGPACVPRANARVSLLDVSSNLISTLRIPGEAAMHALSVAQNVISGPIVADCRSRVNRGGDDENSEDEDDDYVRQAIPYIEELVVSNNAAIEELCHPAGARVILAESAGLLRFANPVVSVSAIQTYNVRGNAELTQCPRWRGQPDRLASCDFSETSIPDECPRPPPCASASHQGDGDDESTTSTAAGTPPPPVNSPLAEGVIRGFDDAEITLTSEFGQPATATQGGGQTLPDPGASTGQSTSVDLNSALSVIVSADPEHETAAIVIGSITGGLVFIAALLGLLAYAGCRRQQGYNARRLNKVFYDNARAFATDDPREYVIRITNGDGTSQASTERALSGYLAGADPGGEDDPESGMGRGPWLDRGDDDDDGGDDDVEDDDDGDERRRGPALDDDAQEELRLIAAQSTSGKWRGAGKM